MGQRNDVIFDRAAADRWVSWAPTSSVTESDGVTITYCGVSQFDEEKLSQEGLVFTPGAVEMEMATEPEGSEMIAACSSSCHPQER